MVALAAFALGSAWLTNGVTARSVAATSLSDTYERARYAVAQEESLERKYRLEPSAAVLAKFRAAAAELVAALKRVEATGAARDREAASDLLVLHERFVGAANALFSAVDARALELVLAFDEKEDSLFVEIADGVGVHADEQRAIASRQLSALREREHSILVATPVAFGVGMLALVFLALQLTRLNGGLRASEDRYARAVRGTSDGLWDWNRAADDYYLSPRLGELLGFGGGELAGGKEWLFSRIHPDDMATVQTALQAHLEQRVPYEVEYRMRCKGGDYRWFRGRGQAEWDEQGRDLRMAGTISDITERKKVEAALEIQGAALASSVTGVAISDLAGVRTYTNPAFARMWGYDGGLELVGMSFLEFWQSPEEATARQEETFAVGHSSGEMIARRRDGSTFPVMFTSSVVRDDAGVVLGQVGSFVDVSEHRELEAQLRVAQKLEAMGTLAAGVAHDFNNLLTAIIGYAELAEATLPAEAPERRNVREIRLAGERAATLTRQLLTFARREPVQARIVHLGDVVVELEKLLGRVLGDHIEVSTDVEPGLWAFLADVGQVEQVVMNLAVNARDAMPAGGRLELRVANDRIGGAAAGDRGIAPGDYVGLIVADAGVGMSAEVLEHVFEPFFTTKQLDGGTGLGLATVYGIVQSAGGHILIESAPGSGTTVRVLWPRCSDAAAVAADPVAAVTTAGAAETVLLVDDDVRVLQLTGLMLRRLGYSVLEAETPAEAIRIATDATQHLDLLLTDVMMPQISGTEVAGQICAMRPGLPVLLMSGYTEHSIDDFTSAHHGYSYIEKPFTAQQLAIRIQETLA